MSLAPPRPPASRSSVTNFGVQADLNDVVQEREERGQREGRDVSDGFELMTAERGGGQHVWPRPSTAGHSPWARGRPAPVCAGISAWALQPLGDPRPGGGF